MDIALITLLISSIAYAILGCSTVLAYRYNHRLLFWLLLVVILLGTISIGLRYLVIFGVLL